MLCVFISYIIGGTFSLKPIPKDKFFEKLFTAILFTLRNLKNLWEEIAEEILFVFYFDISPGARTLSLRQISQHTIHYTAATSLDDTAAIFSSVRTLRKRAGGIMSKNVNLVQNLVKIAHMDHKMDYLIIKFNDLQALFFYKIHG